MSSKTIAESSNAEGLNKTQRKESFNIMPNNLDDGKDSIRNSEDTPADTRRAFSAPVQRSLPYLPPIDTERANRLGHMGEPAIRFLHMKRFDLTMGLRKPKQRWLSHDENYERFWEVRRKILDSKDRKGNRDKYGEVLQCLPGSEDACIELLEVVTNFLVKTYPSKFRFRGPMYDYPLVSVIPVLKTMFGEKRAIENRKSGELFGLGEWCDMPPMEIVARLCSEDFNILKKDSEGQHRLIASATLFPAGWKLKERIGWTVTQLHEKVPSWYPKLSQPVEHYFDRLNEENCMERTTYFIQNASPWRTFFSDLDEFLFIQEGKDFLSGVFRNLTPESIIVRHERQTFTRLPKSDTVLFTVNTSLVPLVDLTDEQLDGLASEICSWPHATARYRGRDLWGEIVVDFCTYRTGIEYTIPDTPLEVSV